MSNMKHCRFQNTYIDLKEAYDTYSNLDSIEQLSPSEQQYLLRLLQLCTKISNEIPKQGINLAKKS